MKRIEGDFLKSVYTLLMGSGLNQLIPFFASFLLARLYSPDDFGAFGVFISFSLIAQNIISLKYDQAICIPQNKKESLYLSYGALVIAIINTLLLSGILFFVSSFELPGKLALLRNDYFLLAPLYVLISQVVNVFYQNCFLSGDYRVVAKTRIWWAGVSSSMKIFFGIFSFQIWGLIIGNVSASFVVCLLLWSYVRREGYESSFRGNFKKVKAVLKKYGDYSLFSTPSGFFNSLTNVGIPMIMGLFFSASEVGAYFFMLMVFRNPLGLLQNAISESFRKEANTLFYSNRDILKDRILKIQVFMGAIMGMVLLVGVLWGSVLFEFFFGHKWLFSGGLIKYVAIQIFFNGLYNPISFIEDLLRKQRVVFIFNLSMALCQIMALVVVGHGISFEMGIFAMALVGAVHFLFINFFMLRYLKNIS